MYLSLSFHPLKSAGLLFFIFAFSATAIAQNFGTTENKLDVGVQFRPRLEFREGAFRPLNKGEKPAALISQRTRIAVDYQYEDKLSIRISPQNVSVWGQGNMVQGVENSGNRMSLFEAWAKLNLSPTWNLKMGRQVISLDDERIFGELDWAQGGRAHDAVAIQMQNNDVEFKGFFAFNQNYGMNYGNNINNPAGNYYNTQDAFPYKWMQTLWAGFALDSQSKISLLATNLGLQNYSSENPGQDTSTYFTQILGANYFFTGDAVKGQLSGYYQGGKDQKGTKMNAYLFSAALDYGFHPGWQIGVGSDLLSGNDVGSTADENKAFNPYFHTGHKFYGGMDYFYVGNAHGNVGLSDTYLKLNYKNNKGLSLGAVFHQFFTPNNISLGSESYSKNLGQELDFTFGYTLNKFASLVGGYSFYLNTSTVDYLKNVADAGGYQQWAWLSVNITPRIFSAKW